MVSIRLLPSMHVEDTILEQVLFDFVELLKHGGFEDSDDRSCFVVYIAEDSELLDADK